MKREQVLNKNVPNSMVFYGSNVLLVFGTKSKENQIMIKIQTYLIDLVNEENKVEFVRHQTYLKPISCRFLRSKGSV